MDQKPRLIAIVDIDSTISNNDHRATLLQKRCIICLADVGVGFTAACSACGSMEHKITQSSWDAFLKPELMLEDPPIPEAQAGLARLRQAGFEVHFLTGRLETLRPVTEAWLRKCAAWNEATEALVMRPIVEDGIAASVYKETAFKRLVTSHNLHGGQFIFFEDDPHVFNTYSKYGLVVRCPEGWVHTHPEGARNKEASFKR